MKELNIQMLNNQTPVLNKENMLENIFKFQKDRLLRGKKESSITYMFVQSLKVDSKKSSHFLEMGNIQLLTLKFG